MQPRFVLFVLVAAWVALAGPRAFAEDPDVVRPLSVAWYRAVNGALVVVGDLVNDGETPLEDVFLDVVLKDAAGEVIAIERGLTLSRVVFPHTRVPWRAFFPKETPDTFDSVELDVSYEPATTYILTSTIPTNMWRVAEANLVQQFDDQMVVVGRAVNLSESMAYLPSAILVAYDADGKVVGVGDAITSLYHIPPNGEAFFEVSTSLARPAASFDVLMEAYLATDAERVRFSPMPLDVRVEDVQTFNGGLHKVKVAVANQGDEPLSELIVAGRAYAQGQLVAVNATSSFTGTLEPGMSGQVALYLTYDAFDADIVLSAEAMVAEQPEAVPVQAPFSGLTWRNALVLLVMGLLAGFVVRWVLMFVNRQPPE